MLLAFEGRTRRARSWRRAAGVEDARGPAWEHVGRQARRVARDDQGAGRDLRKAEVLGGVQQGDAVGEDDADLRSAE